jgi:hypothetical protein
MKVLAYKPSPPFGMFTIWSTWVRIDLEEDDVSYLKLGMD